MGGPLLLVIYFVFSMLVRSSAWVFTDVNYESFYKSLFEEVDYDYGDFNITDAELKQMGFSLLYPGTKWCGPGNSASNYDDLGPAIEADRCCRGHDNCPDVISAMETRHNLTNKAFYTRLSCNCDETFRKCLRQANNGEAFQIGSIYFNALGTKCFRRDYKIIGCKKHGGWLDKKCLKYRYDYDSDKKYQWFDVPNY